jgi:hypothetical protein
VDNNYLDLGMNKSGFVHTLPSGRFNATSSQAFRRAFYLREHGEVHPMAVGCYLIKNHARIKDSDVDPCICTSMRSDQNQELAPAHASGARRAPRSTARTASGVVRPAGAASMAPSRCSFSGSTTR